MKINKNMGRLLLMTAVAATLAAVTAQAQYLNTFDTPGSITTGTRTYNPPPTWVGYDYGNATADSVAWSSLDAAGNPSSGSVELNWTWDYADNGAGSAGFTFDIYPYPGVSYVGGTLSFDLYLASSSTPGGYSDYGYFQVFTRDTSYDDNATSLGEGLSTAAGGVGVWTLVTIPLDATSGNSIRAITFQDYNDSGRSINGSETIYIDNLQLTPVPEPSSIALVGLGLAGLLFVRRNRTAKS